MAHRDSYSDTSRTGPPMRREDCMVEIDTAPMTLAEEKRMDKAMGNRGSGTRGAADMAPAGDA